MRATFTAPLPGLGGLEYDLVPSVGAQGLYGLQSLENPHTRLHLLDAGALHAYTPSLPSDALAQLNLTGPPLILLIAAVHGGDLTLNLMAPILLNTLTGACTQVILDGNYPLRAVFSDC